MPSRLSSRPDDDPTFIEIATRLVSAIESPFDALIVIRIRNWFDHKWLRFSGNGRVPYEHFRASHPGVALAPFHQDKLTFPPFNPRRVLSEDHFIAGSLADPPVIHTNRRQQSATNLHRRANDYARRGHPFVAFWISTASGLTGRASLMAYSCTSPEGSLAAWYASFLLVRRRWELNRVKDIDRRQVLTWIQPDDSGHFTSDDETREAMASSVGA